MRRVVRAGSPEIVKIAGADSSPCSAAETSFRELDDVFLQTQTRIWLGEVLHIRFDEETTISDLLANGELLFQVSKVVWKMLLKKNVELKYSNVYIHERTSFGNSDGRYMPYPKVDSFLKICQILGLTGVDLFSPSDVVEKRDVRRVCMCIRSFSKKARSKNLNVPDFDIVTYTIAMPTDMVGGIRRNLEQSQYSSSSSNSCCSPSMDPRELYRQKSPGGQSTLHYDSYSESDEAESAFTEFEFQSPLSNVSYDATNFSNVIGEESREGNSVVDGDLSGLQAQFRLDTQEQIEPTDTRSTQNSWHKLKVELNSKSFSSHAGCQFDQDAGACFLDTGEVMSQLSNPRNIVGLNIVDTSSYQDFVSTCGHDPHDLDEPHAVDAEEAIIRYSPTLLGKCFESDLAKCSSSDIVVTVDHPKEAMNELVDPSIEIQTVNRRPVDGVKFECLGSTNKSNTLGFQDMVHEKTPQQTNKLNAEGKKEESSIRAFQIDPSNSVDEVALPGNCIKLQDDTSDLIIHNGSDLEISDEGYSLSVGSVVLEHKDTQNGLKTDDDEEEVAQVCSISSSISLEDKYLNNEFIAYNLSFPQASNPDEVDLCDSAKNDCVTALVNTASEVNDSVGKQSLSAEIGTSLVVPTVCADNGRSYPAGWELISLTIPNNHKVDTACHTMSCSDSGSGKNDLVLSNQLDSISGLSDMQCKNNCFNCNPISDCNGNEPKICSSRDGYTLGERDHSNASTCDLEVDADDQGNNPIMPIMHEDMRGNRMLIGESNIYINTTLYISENQLGALPCNSQTDEAMKMKIPQEKDTSYHLYDMQKNASIKCIENYTEKLSTRDSYCADVLSIPHIELRHAIGRETGEQISPPMENGIAEKEVLDLGPCMIDIIKKLEVQTEEMNSSNESNEIHNVSLETPFQDGAPEATFTHDPVGNCMTCSISSSCVKDGIQNHKICPCSIPAHTTKREICAKEGSDANNQGDALIKENEADDNGKIKEPKECEKELVPKLNPSEKPKERGKGKRVLKSVAGAVTLIGALFLVHHIRQKRDKEKSTESIPPQQNHKLRHELPEQKKVDAAKPAAVYPGERLKF